jgi:hypothetical protein
VTSVGLTAFSMLTALASAVFAAVAGGAFAVRSEPELGRDARGTGRHGTSPGPAYLAAAGGFVLALVLFGLGVPPNHAWAGGLIASAALLLLFRSRLWVLAAGAAGVAAGAWVGILQIQGVPLLAAIPLAAVAPALSLVLAARRPGFAPPDLADEALLAVAALGLVVVVAPEVSSGWRSAALLNADDAMGASLMLPAWLLLACGALAVLGGFHSIRRRR